MADSDLGGKEVAKLLGEYHREVGSLIKDVTGAVGALDKFREDYETSWTKKVTELAPVLSPLLVIILVVLFFDRLPCGSDFEFGDIKMNIACEKEITSPSPATAPLPLSSQSPNAAPSSNSPP